MILECYEHGEKIKNALEIIEKMIELADDDLEQGVPCSSEKIGVLESIKKILVPEFDLK
jgi:hypothetical protein